MSADTPVEHERSRELERFLQAHKENLIQHWTRRVIEDPEVPEASRLNRPALIDHIPRIFDRLLYALKKRARGEGGGEELGREHGSGPEAKHHADARFEQHYSLAQALREISHLRAVLLELLHAEKIALDCEEAMLLHAAIDEAMSTVAVRMEQVARRELAFEHGRLRTVLELLPVGVFFADTNGHLLSSNPAAHAIWGVSESLADHPSRLDGCQAWLPGKSDRVKQEEWGLSRALASGETVHNQEIDILGFDGKRRTILHSATPLVGEAGEVVGAVSVCVDVTDRMRIARELQQSIETRERLLGVLGHDLRNPLSTIRFAAAILQAREDMPEGAHKPLARIVTSAERMGRLIEDLLDFTRCRAGMSIPISPKPMKLGRICRQVIEELEISHPDREIEFVAKGSGEGEWDSDRMAQVLSNLVGNALSYSPADTVVRVELREEDQGVRLEVQNLGKPIPTELLPTIFEPFSRAPDAGKVSPSSMGLGLGLGLFISREIVKAHGGTIEVQSNAEQGTRFTVVLPKRRSLPTPA